MPDSTSLSFYRASISSLSWLYPSSVSSIVLSVVAELFALDYVDIYIHVFLLFSDFKLEFVDDVYEAFEDRESHAIYKLRRAAGVIMAVVAAAFLFSVL